MSAQHTPARRLITSSAVRSFIHLGLPEARFYLGCTGHMHAFFRVGYRSGAFPEDRWKGSRCSAIAKASGSTAA